MIAQLVLGTGLTIMIVILHVGGLVLLSRLLSRIANPLASAPDAMNATLLLAVAVLLIVGIHTVEAWVWALVYLGLGEFTEIQNALYFSVVTSTTLGYGDVTLSDHWKLLGTFEAMCGLILFGASTAFLFELMRRLFDPSRGGREDTDVGRGH